MNETTNRTNPSAMNERLASIMDRYKKLVGTDPEDSDLDKIEKLARGLDIYSVAILEALLSRAKKEANYIMSEDIPLLLAEYGLSKATMLDGTEVYKDTFYETSQTDCDRDLLAAWLEENGYGQIIKDSVQLDKGEYDAELERFLVSHGYNFRRDSSVNGQTLKKTIKDHILSGGAFPPENAVKVRVFEMAVIKPPKKQKGF